MAPRGRVEKLIYARGKPGDRRSKKITGILQRMDGGAELAFEAPASMSGELSINSIVEFKPHKGKLEKWKAERVKVTKVIS